jgi:hypothetical protein
MFFLCVLRTLCVHGWIEASQLTTMVGGAEPAACCTGDKAA